MDLRTVGVEEELLLVDPESGRPTAVSRAALAHDEAGGGPAGSRGQNGESELEAELMEEQIETGTEPCVSLGDLGREVRHWREVAASAARDAGARIAAVGTSPVAVDPSTMPKERYERMSEAFGLTAQEQLTCGCHVHVQVESDEEGVAVLDRIRPWLAPLRALSANSPFWGGRDTGYASFRSQMWGRWPTAGPNDLFASSDGYREVVDALVASRAALDEGMIYFDARLSRSYPTVEIRVADVCLDPDDAVLIAALSRALVETASRSWRADDPPAPLRTEMLRAASWTASRHGVDGDLLDPHAGVPAPAADVLAALLEHVGPALDDSGERETVGDLLAAVLRRGSGARAQRAAYERRGDVCDVVRLVTERTVSA